MPLVHPCSAPDCPTLTMGRLCLDHEREAALPAAAASLRTLPLPLAALLGLAAGLLAALATRLRVQL